MSAFRRSAAPLTAKIGAQADMRKLDIDFRGAAGMVVGMAHDLATDVAYLIGQLCLEAGRIMEDDSIEQALILPLDATDRAQRLDRLHQSGRDIAALAAAAQVLHRRYHTNVS